VSVEGKFAHLAQDAAEYAHAARRNIENFVGTAQVPVGLAGPLVVNGQHARGAFRIPLATTEGTLVASTCRGAKILNEVGGVTTRVTRAGLIARAPVFRFTSLDTALAAARDLEQDWTWLIPVVSMATRHGSLHGIRTLPMGRYVHVRIELSPGEAAGQNMVSIVAKEIAAVIVARYPGIERVWLEGGFSGEKMASSLNGLFGRGIAVAASAQIPDDVLMTVARTTGAELVEFLGLFSNAVSAVGAQYSHASLTNIIPALYIATGQDVACLPESCRAFNQMRYDAAARTLHWELVCPSLVLGTIGGGTSLPTQRECLELMGCSGTGTAAKLAELCAGAALANEVSFLSAICADEWVAAHASLRERY
jgi:hydroxymethylglutaryl-CoA reductase (NADPH)